jgi:hypothetical protein
MDFVEDVSRESKMFNRSVLPFASNLYLHLDVELCIQRNIMLRVVDGYNSDEHVLASDSDEECSVCQHAGVRITISEGDNNST